MKNNKQFEIGKWYKYSGKDDKHYFKVKGRTFSKSIIEVSESIHTGNYRKLTQEWAFTINSRLATIEELRKFLPEGHPDLQINNIYELW